MASMSISDLDDRERDREHSGNGIGDDLKNDVPDPDPDMDLAVSVAGDSVTGNASAPTNPRKRKKSSRASVPNSNLSLVCLVLIRSLPTSCERQQVFMPIDIATPPYAARQFFHMKLMYTDVPSDATSAMSITSRVIMQSRAAATARDTTSHVST